MVNESTANLKLPLPHPDNLLEDDVHRIKTAFELLDADSARQDDALKELSSAKADVADLQNVLNALQEKADAEDMHISLQEKADKSACEAITSSMINHNNLTATEQAPGHIQLASDAEATEGTDSTKAVTPKQLKTVSAAATPSPTRDDRANSYQSAGTGSTNTGFKLANGSDIATLFGKLNSVENSSSGTGTFISDVSIAVSGTAVKLTKTKGTPGYCSHCGYCSYCSYCNCNCNCNSCNG